MSTSKRADKVTVGQRIRKAREDKGWSLADLAKRTDRTPSSISMIERGVRKNPRELMKIAKALEESPGYLLLGIRGIDELLERLSEEEIAIILEIPNLEEWQKDMVLDLIRKFRQPDQQ